jgi:O-antigen/teichoic acid export membrane protein
VVRAGAARRLKLQPASRFRIAAVLSVGQIGARGVLAAYFVLLIHKLSPAEYGDFAYATSWLSIVVVVADGGYARLLLREVARGSGEARGRVAWELLATRTGWALATVVAAAVAALLGALSHFSAAFVALLLAAVLFEACSLGLEALGQATDRPWVVSAAQLVAGALLGVWGVLLLLGAPGVTPLLGLAGIAGASALRLVAQGGYWVRLRPAAMPLPSRARALASLREALPYLLLAGLAVLYYRLDVVILHARRGAVETAPYAAAYRAVDAVVIMGGVLFTAIAPHMSRVMASGRAAVWDEWRRYMVRIGVAAVLVAVALGVLSEPLSRLLFGSRYAHSAGQSLALLAPGVAFMLMQTVNAAVVLMDDDTGPVVRLTLFNVGLNLVLTWILTGAHGSRGASIATSTAEVVTFLGFTALVWLRYGREAEPDAQ